MKLLMHPLHGGSILKGRNYRVGAGMPYVRREYIKGSPQPKITKYTMGSPSGNFPVKVMLMPLNKVQVRDNALEAMRIITNKVLADKLGETGYFMRIRAYPHIVLRENKMLSFAGADRIQEGMSRSFGKPIGVAARINPGKPLIEVYVPKEGIETAKESLRQGASKLPTPCIIQIQETEQS